jgi:hypothetical protein
MFEMFSKSRSNDTLGGGICTYIKQSYSSRPLTLSRDFHTFEHQEIFADTNRCKFCVVSIYPFYRPPDTNLSNFFLNLMNISS